MVKNGDIIMDCEDHDIIRIEDRVRYLPTGKILIVKEIYSDNTVGEFNMPSGIRKYRRAIIIPSNDSGHYPIDEEIAKICPKCGKDIIQC